MTGVLATVDALLAHAAAHDVRLRADGDTVHYDAPAAAATDELIAGLRAHKAALLTRLTAPEEVARALLSFQQERMIGQVAGTPNPASFNVGIRLALRGDLDVAAVRGALDALLARHHALRSRFVQQDGVWLQRVVAHRPIDLPVHDTDDADASCRQAAAVPFDLAAEAPVRFRLIRTGERDWVLALVLHHLICDGWAVSTLLREFALAYTALVQGAAPDFGGAAPQCTE